MKNETKMGEEVKMRASVPLTENKSCLLQGWSLEEGGRRGAATITLKIGKGDEPWRSPSYGSSGGRMEGTGWLEQPLGRHRCEMQRRLGEGDGNSLSRLNTQQVSGMVRGSPSPLPGQHTPWVVSLSRPKQSQLGERGQCWSPGQHVGARILQGSYPLYMPAPRHPLVSRRWALLPSCPPQLVLFLEGQVGSVPDTGHACRGQTTALALMASPKPETLGAAHWRLPGPCGHVLWPRSRP